MPVERLEGWMAKPESERKEAEEARKAEWNAWLETHKDSVLNTIGLGRAKSVRTAGIVETILWWLGSMGWTGEN